MRYITKCTKQWGLMVDHASKGMMSLAIDSVASYSWNCTIIARCSWPVRTGLRGASQGARKWWIAVMYAINEWDWQIPLDSQSAMSASRMANGNGYNDSTNSMGSSGMFDVYIVLFIFLAHFWLFAVILVHTTFAACSYMEYFTSNFCSITAMHFLSRV